MTPTATPTATTVAETNVVAPLVALITSARADTGGWAVIPGRPADAESTAWVLLGASKLSTPFPEFAPTFATARDQSHRWLLQQQRADGSWEYRRGPTVATWPTAPVLFALRAHGLNAETKASAVEHAHAWLVDEHSVTPGWWPRLLARFASAPAEEPAVVLDGTLDGYGWARGTFAWVEPTALAMLAMCGAPSADAWRERVAIGAHLLLDRQSPDGGWNYGNKRVLGVSLPGYPDTTGWALLALAAAQHAGVVSATVVQPSMQRAFTALTIPESPFVSPLPVALELLTHRAVHRSVTTTPPATTSRLQALHATLTTALTASLDGMRDGYPMIETRTAILSLLALGDVDVLSSVPTPSVSR